MTKVTPRECVGVRRLRWRGKEGGGGRMGMAGVSEEGNLWVGMSMCDGLAD